MRILVVEDDKAISSGLEYSLTGEGYSVDCAYTGAEALDTFKNNEYDLVLLDLMLPDKSGYDVCKAIKSQSDTPTIFLTACDDEVNVVMGLDLGADDYVTKPFRIRELMSRIKSVLRRCGKETEANFWEAGNIKVQPGQARVWKDGEEVFLTALEYRLLLFFLQHKGQALTRDQLLEAIWDAAGEFVNDNTLTVYIKRLREKLENDPQNPEILKTVRGIGYKFMN